MTPGEGFSISATEGVHDDDGTNDDEHVPEPERCGSFGCVLPRGHNMGQADIPENHKTDRQVRAGRCPDGGWCHWQTLAAGLRLPCEAGECLRVQTSGPLSGVFPGDVWPAYVLAAAGMAREQCFSLPAAGPGGEHRHCGHYHVDGDACCGCGQVPQPPAAPDGAPLREAIRQVSDLQRVLGVAMGSRDGQSEIEIHLAMGAQLARRVVALLVQANRNLTGRNTIKWQGETYTDSGNATPSS